MDSAGILISFFSLVIGVLTTIIVSSYYFRRSNEKLLIPYLDFAAQLLSGVDPEVKKDLSIKFQGEEVEDLLQVQYLIANTGERPVRDLIKPLGLTIPSDGKILDASIQHIHPEGREVSILISENKESVNFIFPLLNKGEFFIVKLLIDGTLRAKDLRFSIAADDLPPTLEVKRLPRSKVKREEEESDNKVDKDSLWAGFFVLFLSLSPLYLVFQVGEVWPEFSFEISYIGRVLEDISLAKLATILSWVAILFWIILGVAMIAGAFETFEFRKQHKYIIPRSLSRPRAKYFEFEYEIDRLKDAKDEEISGSNSSNSAGQQAP